MNEDIQTNEVPIEPRGNDVPNPAEKTVPGSEPKSIDDALAKAFKDQGADEGEEPKPRSKPEPKAEPKAKADSKPKDDKPEDEDKPSRARAEDGKFSPKEAREPAEGETAETQESSGDESEDGAGKDTQGDSRSSEGPDINKPPSRFLPRAKEKWASVDPEVRGEVYRALTEMEKGMGEYKESHEFRKELKPFEEMARSQGVTVKQALEAYTTIDRELHQNPIAGIERVLAQVGVDPVQYAQHILGQHHQMQENPTLAHTQRLEQQVHQLTQHIQQMQQMTEQQRFEAEQKAVYTNVEQNVIAPFKSEHPRFDELADDIAFFLNSGKIPSTLSVQQRLAEAYDMAERINPSPSFAKGPLNPAETATLTQSGKKSVSGSPSSGIPTNRPKKKGEQVSIDDALERAFQRVG